MARREREGRIVEDASNAKAIWKQGIDHEVTFWRAWLSGRGGEFAEDFARRMDPNLPVARHLNRVLHHVTAPEIRVLDVGAGPLTAVGKRYRRRPVRITAVDPLADLYDDLLREAGVQPPVRTTWCHGELLLERFRPASFHLAYSQNALDHSYDPVAVIEQMVALTQPGHFVVLEHRRNEGENEEYHGLHQWNFDIEHGHFVIWNAQRRTDMTKLLADRATVHCRYIPRAKWLNIRMRVRVIPR